MLREVWGADDEQLPRGEHDPDWAGRTAEIEKEFRRADRRARRAGRVRVVRARRILTVLAVVVGVVGLGYVADDRPLNGQAASVPAMDSPAPTTAAIEPSPATADAPTVAVPVDTAATTTPMPCGTLPTGIEPYDPDDDIRVKGTSCR